MRDIVKPLTPDGLCGYDIHGQLWLWKAERTGGHSGHIIGDPRGHCCRICLQGWILTCESLGDQVKNEYDEWGHMSCRVRVQGLIERDMWYGALCDAHIRFERIVEIPNEYWPAVYPEAKRPWFQVQPKHCAHQLKLGRRKRVWSLSIEGIPGRDLNTEMAKQLFEAEEVTKQFSPEGILIHAWTKEKLHEYLAAFHQILDLTKIYGEKDAAALVRATK